MLSIVVPVYNEGEGIKDLLAEIESKVSPPFEILVVYDMDSDNTVSAIKKLWDENPHKYLQIRLVKNYVCRGPSGAIRSGILSSAGDEILVTMGDLSDDMSQVDEMRRRLRCGNHLVCPSRYCAGGNQELLSIKAWIPRWVGKTLRFLTGIETHDTTNSFRLYSKKALNSFPLVSVHSFSVTLEILSKAFCVGYKIVEIPTVWNARKYGKSRFPFLGSLISYLPWFFLAMTRNRFLPFPLVVRKMMVGFKEPAES